MKFVIAEKHISSDDVFEMVQEFHHNQEDFEEGDIADRIYKYVYYEERQIPIEIIDNTEWTIYDHIVDKLVEKINNGVKIYPVVLDEDYGIIDGTHRVEAYKKIGIKNIDALVGIG